MLLFSHREVPKIYKMKNFLHLGIAEIDMGGSQLWVEKNDSGHKN